MKMKTSNIIAMLMAITLLSSSCEDEDKLRAPEFVIPVILLAQDRSDDSFVLQDLENESYSFTLAYENFDGATDGHQYFVGRSGATSSLTEVTLLVSYSGAAGSAEGIIGTYQESEFPVSINLSPQQLANVLNLDPNLYAGGDQFVITYEYMIDAHNSGELMKLTTPSNDYCGGFTDEGEFCQLSIGIICSQVIADPPGDYTINFGDSFGDGWNNAAIRVVADGIGTDYTLDDGSSGTTVVTIPEGTSTLTFEFVSGDFDNEVTYTIVSPSGNTIASGGPSPSVGTITLDLCEE